MESCWNSEDQLIDMAELFKVFGDSTRIKILCCLFEGEMFVQELADRVGASQSAISHQLRILKQAKLVKNRRQGKLVGYSLADDHVKTILGMAKEHLEEEMLSLENLTHWKTWIMPISRQRWRLQLTKCRRLRRLP